ncbi:DNA repair protein REV1 [Heracleum sosnowskyi]|uniref:DNA repair protein REV1 n=1 Tax=Heracleum sosnowskyi TaxID=360622 RepID=A0AAD8JE54_9APIA|nr:DNA repair protein REV1 [Heracleum sosnowskyi]
MNSRSKRTLNSNSTSKSTNKKKKTNQKTLGVAWTAANSRSSAFKSAPFSDTASYMAVKNQKLHEQFDAAASTSVPGELSSGKPIFHGVSIFVDGFTIPSSQELRGYMLKYGGRFVNYFSRHRVTHIICSNLPDSKLKNLRSFSAGLPVLKPTWVLDSVAANKLLSWHSYQLDQLATETEGQPKLSTFFPLKRSPFSCNNATNVIGQPISKIEDQTPKLDAVVTKNSYGEGQTIKEIEHCNNGSDIPPEVDPVVNENSYGESESVEEIKHANVEIDYPLNRSLTKAKDEDIRYNDLKLREPYTSEADEPNTSEPGDATSDSILAGNTPKSGSSCQPSTSYISYCADKEKISESSISRIGMGSGHSTLEDPNFVENYFKHSRLHFIGTWRNRYRKRFPATYSGIKGTNSSLRTCVTDEKATIIHVDMDCFFVSVVIRNQPELQGKPVAVCHSDNPRGTAEISSANYPARAYGVRAGIFVRDAKSMCPDLVIVPYNFEAYEEVADQFYDILHKHCNKVQAVSCDEAFLDVSDSEVEDHQRLASIIRKEVFDTTGCKASVGISGNMLMARLATRTAKPDGQCYIPAEKVEEYLDELPVKALPGIGHVLEDKLKRRNVKTCKQLRLISKESLQKEFGLKTGDMLWNYSRGIDNRSVGVFQESKSIGAEVNWGVRFNNLEHCQQFLLNLCEEVSLRLQGGGVQGRTFTLKVKKRKNDARDPVKYMGCGECENLSHSITVPMATDDVDGLQRIAIKLFDLFHIDVKEIRGMGLLVSKLENADSGHQGNQRNSLRSWLVSASTTKVDQYEVRSIAEGSCERDVKNQNASGNLGQSCTKMFVGGDSSSEAHVNEDPVLPPLCDLDMGVVENLPSDLFSELNNRYGGKLITFISKRKGKLAESNIGGILENRATLFSSVVPLKQCTAEKTSAVKEAQAAAAYGVVAATSDSSFSENDDVMPYSLSQIDISVLHQLPEEMRADILELLPAHRKQECNSDLGPAKSCPQQSYDTNYTEDLSGPRESISINDFWLGNPPIWVEDFKKSSCLVLSVFADSYYKSGSTGQLSSILQRAMSDFVPSVGSTPDGLDNAVLCLCNLFKQYIKLKIETDIEEIYLCFRLLKRLSRKSTFFLEAYNIILPEIQATLEINDFYLPEAYYLNQLVPQNAGSWNFYQSSYWLLHCWSFRNAPNSRHNKALEALGAQLIMGANSLLRDYLSSKNSNWILPSPTGVSSSMFLLASRMSLPTV